MTSNNWDYPISPYVGYGWSPTQSLTFTSDTGIEISNIPFFGTNGAFAGSRFGAVQTNALGLRYGAEVGGAIGLHMSKQQMPPFASSDGNTFWSPSQKIAGWGHLNLILGYKMTQNMRITGKVGSVYASIDDHVNLSPTTNGRVLANSTNGSWRNGVHTALELEMANPMSTHSKFVLGAEYMNFGRVNLNLVEPSNSAFSALSNTYRDSILAVNAGFRVHFHSIPPPVIPIPPPVIPIPPPACVERIILVPVSTEGVFPERTYPVIPYKVVPKKEDPIKCAKSEWVNWSDRFQEINNQFKAEPVASVKHCMYKLPGSAELGWAFPPNSV